MGTHNKLNSLPVLALSAGMLFVFIVFIFPLFDLKTTTGGLESLDLRWSYSQADVWQLFTALGADGIKLYKEYLLVDLVYPLVYGSALIISLSYSQERMGRLGKRTAWMRWLPIAVVVLDYFENFNTWQMLSAFPALAESSVRIGSNLTFLKWCGVSICIGLMICSFLIVVLRSLRWKCRNQRIGKLQGEKMD